MLRLSADEHSWASRTLPWLVNNRLRADELRRLRAHLERCAQCREELRWEQVLAQRIGAVQVVAYAPQLSLTRVLQRIDAAEALSGPAWWQGLRRGLRAKRRTRRSAFAFAIAAQAAVIAILGLALSWLSTRPLPAPEYRTLSREVPAAQAAAQLQVVFAASVTTAEMQATLAQIGGRIVSGPSPAGVFLVATGRPRASQAELDALARTLAAQAGVDFVAVLRE